MSLTRHIAHHPRLAITICLGIVVGLLLPAEWHIVTRALLGWNVGVWAYLLSISWLVVHADHTKVRELAEMEDNSAIAVLATMSVAAVFSLVAIILVLADPTRDAGNLRLAHYGFTALTVMGSWLLVGVLFTVHYAHMYYRADDERRPLQFPDGERNPDYWDFLYFSFTIAVAAQTSDVTVMSRSMRKAVLAQSVLSFLFNAAVLGLSVNIAASMVKM